MIPRLFVDALVLANGRAYLGKPERHYLTKVLRLGVGAPVHILDGDGGLYRSQISLIGKQDLVCDLGPLEAAEGEPDREVHLWIPVLKGEKMDWLVQKVSEIGVATVHLMETERTIVRGADAKVDRWRKIAREAAEQCERGRIPKIFEPRPLAERSIPMGAFFCAERRRDIPGIAAAAREITDEPIHVLVGPEGGWTETEVQSLVANGAEPVSLGPRTLRAETAALAALCLLLLPV